MYAFNWDNLKVFLAVARTQSALDAAQVLGVDQSTISRRLHQLEKDIGCLLFDRSSQGHHLTSIGHRLLSHAEKLESAISSMEADIFDDSTTLAGDIRLGTTEAFGSYFLAPHLARFCTRHPNIAVELLPMPRNINLSKREADIGVSIERPAVNTFVTCRMCDYRLLPYATHEYLQRSPPIKKIDDLRKHQWIDYVDDLVFTSQQFTLRNWLPGVTPFFRSTSVIAQFQAACAGVGLAFLPCFLASTAPGLVPVLPQDIHVTRTFWLAAPQDKHALARIKALWVYLRQIADLNREYLFGYSKDMQWHCVALPDAGRLRIQE